MKRTISILFLIIILSSIVGCKKDDVKVQSFTVVSENVDKRATSITITLNYTYPSVIKTVDGYISDNSNMDNATNAQGEINGKTIKLKFNDLQANTTYFYCYEYSNGIDLTKSEIKTITTNDYGLPMVTTNEVTDITNSTAVCGGHIDDDGGLAIEAKGVCWGTSQNPTINDNHSTDGIGIDSYTSQATDLATCSTYYIRAYATNALGTAYGELRSFVAINPGSIKGFFSVSTDKQVCFSQGNIQYQATTNTWKFAENQYDYIGYTNQQVHPTYNGWIDLFGWGTSGYDHGAICYQPWSTSETDSDYYAYGSPNYNLSDQNGMADWGYNKISNGGNAEHMWRTLTGDEWVYIFNTRETISGIRYARAKVNDIGGVILLPDDWSNSYYNLNSANTPNVSCNTNVIDAATWTNYLEANGAVFLTAAGQRHGFFLGGFGSYGYYWSATVYDGTHAHNGVSFDDNNMYILGWPDRYYCLSVRLVCDAE